MHHDYLLPLSKHPVCGDSSPARWLALHQDYGCPGRSGKTAATPRARHLSCQHMPLAKLPDALSTNSSGNETCNVIAFLLKVISIYAKIDILCYFCMAAKADLMSV